MLLVINGSRFEAPVPKDKLVVIIIRKVTDCYILFSIFLRVKFTLSGPINRNLKMENEGRQRRSVWEFIFIFKTLL